MVGLSGRRRVEGTTTAGESGSILYSGRLSIEREIRANLTGNAVVGVRLARLLSDPTTTT